MKDNGKIRDYVFAREQEICRCCRLRRAESMHELVFRSQGGKVSKRNSVAVCGQLVGTEQCCHTYLQQYEIEWQQADLNGAEGQLEFKPVTDRAAEWMRIRKGLWVASMPGGRNEEMEAC